MAGGHETLNVETVEVSPSLAIEQIASCFPVGYVHALDYFHKQLPSSAGESPHGKEGGGALHIRSTARTLELVSCLV